MKPQNQQEIKLSFYKFLLLFLITIGLFWVLGYWNTALPVYTSNYFEDKNQVLNDEIKFQRKFNGFVRLYLDSLAYYETNNQCQDYKKLKHIINTLRLELEKNKIYHQKPMYDSTIAALNDYHETKEKNCNKNTVFVTPKKRH